MKTEDDTFRVLTQKPFKMIEKMLSMKMRADSNIFDSEEKWMNFF